ncbi:MAG: hypoxanthine phosphoribosyltransferase [Krumholzibacteria bacterium]|nr:hypoxanthine phosphoribosyltransferase [Candidatus Krumholzibacteria bacterium]
MIERVLISSEDITRRIRQLGNEISRDYQGSTPIFVCILKGAYPFLADLTRCVSVEHEVDFMAVSSYDGGVQSTGVVKIEKDLKANITDRDVVLVEDIIDTGLTISYLVDMLQTRNPRSIRVASLLDKKAARKKEVPLHYVGFEIPKEFVIGYGLDYDEKFRNLPFIGIMKA